MPGPHAKQTNVPELCSYVPALQAEQDAAPIAEYEPEEQIMQLDEPMLP